MKNFLLGVTTIYSIIITFILGTGLYVYNEIRKDDKKRLENRYRSYSSYDINK